MTDTPDNKTIPAEGKPLTAEQTNALLDEAAAKKAKAENEKEQAEYYESFEKALKIVEERIEAERAKVRKEKPLADFRRTPYDRLKEMKAWDAKWVSIQYYLIAGRLSTLPKALRDFILEIGAVARAEYESKRAGEAQKEKAASKKSNPKKKKTDAESPKD